MQKKLIPQFRGENHCLQHGQPTNTFKETANKKLINRFYTTQLELQIMKKEKKGGGKESIL